MTNRLRNKVQVDFYNTLENVGSVYCSMIKILN